MLTHTIALGVLSGILVAATAFAVAAVLTGASAGALSWAVVAYVNARAIARQGVPAGLL